MTEKTREIKSVFMPEETSKELPDKDGGGVIGKKAKANGLRKLFHPNRGKTGSGKSNYAYFLRGFLILCVIYSHSLSQLNSLREITWAQYPLSVVLTSYEMPFFMIVSGFFAFFSIQRNGAGKTIKKRMVSLGLPLVFFQILPAILKLFRGKYDILSGTQLIIDSFFSSKLWYLSCCLLCYGIVCVVQGIEDALSLKNRNAFDLLYIGVMALLMSFQCPVYLGAMFPFFLIGFLLSKYKLLERKGTKVVLYLLAAAAIPCVIFYKPEHSFYVAKAFIQAETMKDDLLVNGFRCLVSISACAFVYLITKYVYKTGKNNTFVRWLSYLGIYSGVLYIAHVNLQPYLKTIVARIPLDFHSLLGTPLLPLILAPLFGMALVMLSLAIDYVLKYIPWLRKIVFGQ